ncbi:extracellular solute-binding protein [Desemzia sp. FAM 24101]|uniref:extracellular solute-binding protein n=1 Tax=unclassified Desemzia TaxID=2685243 RepID=UPI00388AC2CE
MKKKFVFSGLAIPLVFGLVACGNNDNAEDTDGASGQQVLKVSYPSWWEDWFADLEADFEATHDDVDVELIPLFDDTTTRQALMMQSAETSPDVAVEDTFILNSDVNAGYLESMDDVVNGWEDWDLIEETVKQGVTAEDGQIYGVPFSTDVQGLWYNKNIFEEAGLPVPFEPASWEEILTAAETIKGSNSETIPLFMYSTKANGEATAMRTFQQLYFGTGSELYNWDEGKWVVDEQALLDTFTFIDNVYQNDLGPELSVASNSQISTVLAEDLMINDGVAMVMDGNWVAASWREGRATPWPEALDTWDFVAFPTQNGEDPEYTSMSGGWALSIPSNAQNKDLAAEFIKMAVDQEHQTDYVRQTGDMTVRTDVAEDEEYLNQPISNYEEAGEILSYTNFRPAVDDYPTVSTHIQEVVESLVSGNVTPEEAVQSYIEGLERIVGTDNIINQ